MLDLALLSPSVNSFQDNTSTYVLAQSRRPAILTFSSPMVDTVSRIWRMPLYVFGWKKEAETLNTGMMEGVEFAKGWRNLPGSLRLELQSHERMQVYSASVKFVAKFKGLRYVVVLVISDDVFHGSILTDRGRWIMYNFRIMSFFVFSFLFWAVSVVSAVMFWFLLSSYIEPEDLTDEGEEDESSSDLGLGVTDDGFSTDEKPPKRLRKRRRRRARKASSPDRVKKDDEEIKKEEEEIEDTTKIEPLASEADDEVEY
jgi:seipin